MSEDESDTALEFDQPTRKRLNDIFDMPAASSAAAAAADDKDVALHDLGVVAVDPARVLAVDAGSEMARAVAGFEVARAALRRDQRALLGSKLKELNQLMMSSSALSD